MTDIIREEARLIILKELHSEDNGAASDSRLGSVLDMAAINKSRDWLREELRWLADVGAVKLSSFGSCVIAELTAKGAEHVERRLIIPGIRRPSRPRD
ncbi:VpaChn25_0724 family phage protein [Nitrobacter winogradskyi]|uniref:Uncharacterized protein n=2 Tax=Nitrobacter winogradskyi TaxID=913 RepID=A0ACC6AG29_NITWI|nr:hypothetical protein [Nitrobacter winogradskyi]MCP1998805.1 hypothetical protein [Nitrobacter winogradskyi]GEC14273.1 hypothetical protein NWI01_01650 [Nitrobacter winogradskyi]